MLRLKRHIVTEIIEVFLAVIIALILIMVSFQFAKLLSQAASGKIVGSAIYQLLALQVINLFVLLTPFAFFIATLIALSKLAGDSELIALKSVGFSDKKLYQAVFSFTIPLALLILVITLFAQPQIVLFNTQLMEKAKKESEISLLKPGIFRPIGAETVVFVEDMNGDSFNRFFIWQKNQQQETITVAKQGQLISKDKKKYIELTDGNRFGQSSDGTSQLITFEQFDAFLPEQESTPPKEKLKGVPTQQLVSNNDLKYKIELQRRIAPAISILVLALFAPLLVQFNPREKRYGQFVIAILAYAIYANSQHILQALIEDKKIPLYPGIYSIHLILTIGIFAWLGFNRYNAQQGKSR